MTSRLALLVLAASTLGQAHDFISTKLTWTEHVSRIFYRRCVSCHREGGPAPMPLATYGQARPWAKAVKVQVLSRRMPPWGPRKGYGEFRDDRSLSQEEIAVISSWVEGGAPEGDALYLDAEKIPKDFPAPEPPTVDELPVRDGLRLEKTLRVLGLRAEGPTELRAKLPNGAILPLVWIPAAESHAPAAYWRREAVDLPPGTVMRLFGGSATLLIDPADALLQR
jgi:hypothetical protein